MCLVILDMPYTENKKPSAYIFILLFNQLLTLRVCLNAFCYSDLELSNLEGTSLTLKTV